MPQKLRSDGTVRLTARMPAPLAARVQREAIERGITASTVVREIVTEHLSDLKPKEHR